MKHLVGMLCLLVCAGCATPEAMEAELQKLRSELTAKIQQSDEKLRKEHQLQLAEAEKSLRSEIDAKDEQLKKELVEQKALQQKETGELNLTLIKVQKDFYDNRRITEDNARRIYMIETWAAAMRPVSEQKAEGEILYMRGGDVITNLGSKHGLKAGDLVAVYRDYSSKEKLATVRIMVTETTESKGEIIDKTSDVMLGNVVRPIK